MNQPRPPARAHHLARTSARLMRLRHRSAMTPSLDTSILRALGLRATDNTEAFDNASALAAFCAPLCSERELFERIFGHAP
jgi:hypothetical protein